MSTDHPKRIATLKAADVDPKQKEPQRMSKSGRLSFNTEEAKRAEIAGMEKASATGKRAVWQAFDPDYYPPAWRAEAFERAVAAEKPPAGK
jgi:hypothetical protein